MSVAPLGVYKPADEVLELVAKRCGVRMTELQHTSIVSQHKGVVRARSLAAWVLRERYAFSFPELARILGYRDHTSAIEATRRVEREPEVKKQAEAIAAYLVSRSQHRAAATTSRTVAVLTAEVDELQARVARLEAMLRVPPPSVDAAEPCAFPLHEDDDG